MPKSFSLSRSYQDHMR